LREIIRVSVAAAPPRDLRALRGEEPTKEKEPMAAYVIASLAVHDTAWRESYSPKTAELIRKYGGKVLAPFASKVEALEGNAKLPTNVVILEIPSKEQAKAWYNDPEYAPLIKLRQSGADGDLIVVDAA
jgi:uncharacterized protein (DUF1330 family)